MSNFEDFFYNDPCDVACDNCPKSYICDIAYTYSEEDTRCLVQRSVVNLRDDLLRNKQINDKRGENNG